MFARTLARSAWSIVLLLLGSGLAPVSHAQLTDATLKGLVGDPSGARVASSVATGPERTLAVARIRDFPKHGDHAQFLQ